MLYGQTIHDRLWSAVLPNIFLDITTIGMVAVAGIDPLYVPEIPAEGGRVLVLDMKVVGAAAGDILFSGRGFNRPGAEGTRDGIPLAVRRIIEPQAGALVAPPTVNDLVVTLTNNLEFSLAVFGLIHTTSHVLGALPAFVSLRIDADAGLSGSGHFSIQSRVVDNGPVGP